MKCILLSGCGRNNKIESINLKAISALFEIIYEPKIFQLVIEKGPLFMYIGEEREKICLVSSCLILRGPNETPVDAPTSGNIQG